MVHRPTWPITWVDTDEALLDLVEKSLGETYITLDTETVGWEKGASAERLCLIQIGLPSRKRTFLVDALSLKNLEPLASVLSVPEPIVVAHNAHFEERQLSRYNIKILGIRDTLEMARALRQDLPNHTLQTCCRLLLGLAISKEEQGSNWASRPLSDEQIAYAALDAEVTSALYDYLKALEDQLDVDPELPIPELMKQLTESSRDKFELTKSIAPQMGILNRRMQMIEEAIREKLKNGSPPYEGEWGNASIKPIKKTEVNVNKVRELFPDIADRAIAETVERKILTQLLKEYGYPAARIEEVIEVIGHYDRATIEPALPE